MENNYIVINGVKHVLTNTSDIRYCESCSMFQKCKIRRHICGIFGVPGGWHFEILDN